MHLNTDLILLPVLLIGLIGFSVYAAWQHARWDMRGCVRRGGIARDWFYWLYGFISIGLLQLINVSEALVGHKVLVSILSLGSVMYLLFFNGWFRNKLLGWKHTYEEKDD